MSSSVYNIALSNPLTTGFTVDYTVLYDAQTDSDRCPFFIQFRTFVTGDPLNTLEIHQDNVAANCQITDIIPAGGGTITRNIVFNNANQYHGKTLGLLINLISTNPATAGQSLFQSSPFTIDIPAQPPQCNLSINNIRIDAFAQTAEVFISGAFGGIEYSLNGGPFQSSNIFSGVTVGIYTVTARDNGIAGCEAQRGFIMPNPPTAQKVFFIGGSQLLRGNEVNREAQIKRQLESTGQFLPSPNFEDVNDWVFVAGTPGATFSSVPVQIGQTGIGECLEVAEDTTAGQIENGSKESYILPQFALEYTVNGCDEFDIKFNVFIDTNNVIKKPKLRVVQWGLSMTALDPFEFFFLNKNGQFHKKNSLRYNSEIINVGEWVTISTTAIIPSNFQGRRVILALELFNADERGPRDPIVYASNSDTVDEILEADAGVRAIDTIDLTDDHRINWLLSHLRIFNELALERVEAPNNIPSNQFIIPDDFGEDNGFRAWRLNRSNSPVTDVTGENRIEQTLFRQVIIEWKPSGESAPGEFVYTREIDLNNKEVHEEEWLTGDAPATNNSNIVHKRHYTLADRSNTGLWTTRSQENPRPLPELTLDFVEEQTRSAGRIIEATLKSYGKRVRPWMIVIDGARQYVITEVTASVKRNEYDVVLTELKRPVKGYGQAFKQTSFRKESFA